MAGPLQPTANWLLPETLSAACDPTLGAHGTGCPGVAQIPGPCHCKCHHQTLEAKRDRILAFAEWASKLDQPGAHPFMASTVAALAREILK